MDESGDNLLTVFVIVIVIILIGIGCALSSIMYKQVRFEQGILNKCDSGYTLYCNNKIVDDYDEIRYVVNRYALYSPSNTIVDDEAKSISLTYTELDTGNNINAVLFLVVLTMLTMYAASKRRYS